MEENKSSFEEYFKEDLDLLKKEIEKSDEYRQTIEKEVETFSRAPLTGVQTRGSQHYLIEHIKNLVSLQSQKQSLLKDKVSLKKIIMDYQQKEKAGESGEDFQKEFSKFLEENKKKQIWSAHEVPQNSKFLDDEIDKIIKEKEKEDENN